MNALRKCRQSFTGEQVPHVEEIARMLTVERCNDLDGVKGGETNDRHSGESKFSLHPRRH
jgi:hypothetical protein